MFVELGIELTLTVCFLTFIWFLAVKFDYYAIFILLKTQGRAWLNRASKSRSSAWKVGDKQPGTLYLSLT